MKRDLIWIAVAAVAIPLAFSVVNAQAQVADDAPRLGETKAEYQARMSRTPAEHEALRRALEANTEAQRSAQEYRERRDAEYDRAIRAQRARAQERHRVRCNRLSARATLDWNTRAAERLEDECG